MNRSIFLAVAAASATLALAGNWAVPGAGAAARPTTLAAGSPAAFTAGLVRLVAANRYDEAWQRLYPAQQRLVPRARYVGCERLTPVPGHVESLQVLSVRGTLLTVPGDEAAVPAKAVTIRLAIAGDIPGEHAVVTHTYHTVAVDGRWRWFLPAERLATYRGGGCPGYAATPAYTSERPSS